MADFRTQNHGKNATKDVNLVVMAYDSSVSKDDEGNVRGHYLDVAIHPDDPRAEGQRNLHLVSRKDEKSPSGVNNNVKYQASQMDKIKEAAGKNTAPIKTKEGKRVGTSYGVVADVLLKNGTGGILNTQDIKRSDLSVAAKGGKDIRGRMIDSMKVAKEAAPAKTAEPKAKESKGAKAKEAGDDQPEV